MAADRGAKHRRRWPAVVAIGAALGYGAYGVAGGTWAAGGSDSSCFALMADALAAGTLQPHTPLATSAPWSDAPRTFAPAGFVPSPRIAAAASPVCAPGYAVLLAPWRWLGRDAIFLLTPLAGSLLVGLAFVVARHLAGPAAGAAAAVIVATTPAGLFQVTQPMNDVAVAACWMAVVAAGAAPEPSRAWAMGALIGLATFIRPNVAPAAMAAAAWYCIVTSRAPRGDAVRRMSAFTIAAAPFAAALFALNHQLYGHLLSTGYGDPRTLFSVEHAATNLRQYGTAILETQLGIPFLGVLALAIPRRRGIVMLALAVAAGVTSVYLFYQPFPEWWYLRFLLPATAPLTVLAVAVATTAIRQIASGRVTSFVLGAVGVGLVAGWMLSVSRERQVFDLQRLESRFRRSGELVRERLPENAIAITVWHSGTVRFHAGRLSLLWDSLAPAEFSRGVRWLEAQGYEPYLILEQWEEPLFRERFGGHAAAGALDWPPRFDILRQVRIYRLADRNEYLRGGSVPTEYVLR